jgi:hypothetical protein
VYGKHVNEKTWQPCLTTVILERFGSTVHWLWGLWGLRGVFSTGYITRLGSNSPTVQQSPSPPTEAHIVTPQPMILQLADKAEKNPRAFITIFIGISFLRATREWLKLDETSSAWRSHIFKTKHQNNNLCFTSHMERFVTWLGVVNLNLYLT